MSSLMPVRDTVTNRINYVPYPGFYEFDEVVTGSPKTTFTLGMDIDTAHKIKVWVDGRLEKEVTTWNRDASANTVIFVANVNIGSWVHIEVILK